MKKINTFWKIILILILVTFTGILILFGREIYNRKCRSYSSEDLSAACSIEQYPDGKIKILNQLTGKLTTPKIDWIAKATDMDTLCVFSNKCRRGYLNKNTGEILIQPKYEHAWLFSEGMAAVVLNGKLGFINTKDEVVLPFTYYYKSGAENAIDFLFKDGLCTAIDSKGKHGIINKKGEWALSPVYDYINNPVIGYRIVKTNNKYGIIDNKLNLILPTEYDNITIQHDGFALLKNYEQQLVSFDTKTVIEPFVYDEIQNIQYNTGKTNSENTEILGNCKCIAYRMYDKWGIMNAEGKILTKAIYTAIGGLSEDLFTCKYNNVYVTINSKGEKVR